MDLASLAIELRDQANVLNGIASRRPLTDEDHADIRHVANCLLQRSRELGTQIDRIEQAFGAFTIPVSTTQDNIE